MIRPKQLLPATVLLMALLLATLLLALIDPALAGKKEGQPSMVLGGIVPIVIFAITLVFLAVWAALGSGSHTRRMVNCLLAATVVWALLTIQRGRLEGISSLPFFVLSIGIWLGPVWVFTSLRIAGLKWQIESCTSHANLKPDKGSELTGWLLTLVSTVVVWQGLSRLLPGAVFDQTLEFSWGDARKLPSGKTTSGILHYPGVVGSLIFLFLYLPLVVQLLVRLRGWIARTRLRVFVQILLTIVLAAGSGWLFIPRTISDRAADGAFQTTFFLAIITAVTLFATSISLGKFADWSLAQKKRWPLLGLLTVLMWWAMIPGLLLRMAGYRLVTRHDERQAAREHDGPLTASWRAGLVSFSMLTLLLVTSVYAGLSSSGVIRQHELALIGFDEETGSCFAPSTYRQGEHGLFLTDADFAVLRHCPNLERLGIENNPYLTGSFLESLQAQTQLWSLELVNCQRLSAANLDHARHFKQLELLNLHSDHGLEFTAANLSFARSLENLKYMYLDGCQLTGNSVLEPLAELPQLTWLSLGASSVTDQQLIPLGKAEMLSGLHLGETEVGDAGLAHLAMMKNLKRLNLGGTRVSDQGLASLAGHHELYSLQLNSTAITDRGLVHLEQLKELQTLSLEDTGVTGAGLIHLAGLKQLSSLNLGGTRVSDAGLVHLKDLEKLGFLGRLPEFNDAFTPVGLCRLVIYLPDYEEYFVSRASSPFAGQTFSRSRAAGYLQDNVPAEELSADERQQMARLLLAGGTLIGGSLGGMIGGMEYDEGGVDMEYDEGGRAIGVTFNGIPLSADHLQLLSWLPQLSSVTMNYSREEETLVQPSEHFEPDIPPWEERPEQEPVFQQSDLAGLARIPGLENLQLDGTLFTDDVIEHVVKIKGLRSLQFSTSRITGATLRQLEQLPMLQEISFSYGCEELTDEGLLAIAAMPKIRSVSLVDCKKTTGKGLAGILSMPELEKLTLDEAAKNLDQQLLQKLSASRLKSVTLVGELDDSICARLATIASLEELVLSSTVLHGEQLEQLRSLESLVSLKLEGCTSLTMEGMRQLNQLTGLKKLQLNHTNLSDQHLLSLTGLEQLELLDLRVNESLTDQGMEVLAGMSQLTDLSLFYCPGIRGEGLQQLAGLQQLKRLDLGNNKVLDEGLAWLGKNRSILELKLNLCAEITDEGLQQLSEMTQLQRLEIAFCRNVSPEGIARLESSLPDCEIVLSELEAEKY